MVLVGRKILAQALDHVVVTVSLDIVFEDVKTHPTMYVMNQVIVHEILV